MLPKKVADTEIVKRDYKGFSCLKEMHIKDSIVERLGEDILLYLSPAQISGDIISVIEELVVNVFFARLLKHCRELHGDTIIPREEFAKNHASTCHKDQHVVTTVKRNGSNSLLIEIRSEVVADSRDTEHVRKVLNWTPAQKREHVDRLLEDDYSSITGNSGVGLYVINQGLKEMGGSLEFFANESGWSGFRVILPYNSSN